MDKERKEPSCALISISPVPNWFPNPFVYLLPGIGTKIDLEVNDVDGYVDVGLQGTDMHMVDVDVADAEDVNVDDVDDVTG